MKKQIIVLIILTAARAYAANSLEILQNGTINEKIILMQEMGYAGNKTGFWLFVKYLNFESEGADEITASKCRQAAAEALGRIRDDRAVPYLVERYGKEKNINVKRSIMFAFRFYSDESIKEAIIDGISTEDEDLQFQAVLAAEENDDASVTGEIEKLYQSTKQGDIRATCAYILYKKNEEEKYYNFLLTSLTDRSPDTRYWSAHYLGELKIFSSTSSLIKAIEIESVKWVKRKMEDSIARIYYGEKTRKRIAEHKKIDKLIKQKDPADTVQD